MSPEELVASSEFTKRKNIKVTYLKDHHVESELYLTKKHKWETTK
jgi:hypothetical protein